jgi:hypothetical protein
MDAQGTMRLMFDTMDAYDRGDFDRLGEIYAEDRAGPMSTPRDHTAAYTIRGETWTAPNPASTISG